MVVPYLLSQNEICVHTVDPKYMYICVFSFVTHIYLICVDRVLNCSEYIITWETAV